MNRPRLGPLVLTALLGFAPSIEAGAATPPVAPGVIVEKVGAGSLGERAGLKPGDVLVSWQLAPSFPANLFPAAGWLTTPFDLLEALIEQAPRGRLTLSGTRAGTPRAWTLIEGASAERAAIVAWPPFEGETRRLFEEGLRLLEEGEADLGLSAWRAAAAEAFAEGDSLGGLWLLYRRSEVYLERDLSDWERQADETSPQLRAAGQSLAAAELYVLTSDKRQARGIGPESEAEMGKAMASFAGRRGPSLAAARLEARLGRALQKQLRLDLSERYLRSALATRAALAPWSLDLAESLYVLGDNYHATGGLGRALEPYAESEFLLRRQDPGSLRHVRRLLAFGGTLYSLGRVPEAEDLLREALRHASAVAPVSPETGTIYTLLADDASDRAAFREAEEYLRGSIEVYERLPTTIGSRMRRSRALSVLGSIRAAAGDPEGAEHLGRLALEAHTELGPAGLGDTLTKVRLAVTLLELGRFDEARHLLALALSEKPQADGNLRDRARALHVLCELELRAGDLGAATRALQEAKDLYQATDKMSTPFAELLRHEGEIEGALGHHGKALRLLEEALERQRQILPGGVGEASLLRLIGLEHKALGRRAEASRFLCAAVRTLDRLGDRVGRSEGGSSNFFAARTRFYSDCIESLTVEGKEGEAFHVLESGHARGLLEMLAYRDLSTSDLPSETRDERKRLRDRYESLYSTLSGWRTVSDAARDTATRLELANLQVKLEALADRVRRESPRFAALHDPQPLSLAEARQSLDPGTVLLAYSVGETRGHLFVVRAAGDAGAGLAVHRLAISAERLRLEVQALTALMKDRRASLAKTRSRARALYRLLIAPAARALAGSERVLIAPDGPLHGLPFAALLGPDGRYLVQAKPLHTIISATVYAEIKKERRTKSPTEVIRVAAFGDPVYPPTFPKPSGAVGETDAGLILRGVSLAPLPGTRREVEAIGALYPNSQVYVGGDATEERLKALGRAPDGPRILHFAGHAVLDQRMPINSFLAFSLPEQPAPGRENGLLQAWEIFEDVRLDADLVTLSACNTALGKEMGGEGLVGLTRAFQFAGARSVLASLWAIADGATARFMPRFYEHLRSGLTKDQALRQTQIEWIRDPKRSHPSHWAAFELVGDYK